MKKIDYIKEYKELYKVSKNKISIVSVPKMRYLMIDGQGDPNTSKEYKEAIETLYPVSYTLKFMVKKSPMAIDYRVGPLEGLWWANDMKTFSKDKSAWLWTAMILQPNFITSKMVDEAIKELKNKKKNIPAISKLRLEYYLENQSAQTLYIGPYSEEGPTIKKIHEHIKSIGGKFDGKNQKHHEIYLSDPRRSAPEKLKTIIRQPFIK